MTQIEYENKIYEFSWWSIIVFIVFTPIIAIVIYQIWDIFWVVTHEPVISQTTDLINLLNLMDPPLTYRYIPNYHFEFVVPGRGSIGFHTDCTGIQANAIFAGIILSIPHSKNKETNKNIWIRKIFSLAVSWILFYVVNILRMVIQLTLYYNGAAWADIHTSISAASSFIAAIIILLMHKWIPEFIISIVWVLGEIKTLREKRESTLISNQDNNFSEELANKDLNQKD